MNTIGDVDKQLQLHAINFRKWVADAFSEEDRAVGQVDDSGYPEWSAIAKDIKILFNDLT